MRVQFNNKIVEFNGAGLCGDNNRFVELINNACRFTIDCKTPERAKDLMNTLLIDGYFDTAKMGYDSSNDNMELYQYIFRKSVKALM